jgi:hypothetical protein
MSRPEKDSLDRKIRRISDDPGIGEGKKGNLRGVFRVTILLAESMDL